MADFSDFLTRVRYAETDQMGVVYYSNYLVYFEIGRVEYIRERGADYKQMELQDDCYIFVAQAQCRYMHPARYDDLLRIRTRVTELRKRTIRFAYEIANQATGETLATGETVHVICTREGKPKSLPDKYRSLFPVAQSAD